MSQDRDRKPSIRWRLAPVVRFVAVFACLAAESALAQTDRWAEPRAAMVRTIEAHAMSLPPAAGGDGIAPAVIDVMARVPRHRFVPARAERLAYADRPLSIGYGQTISQPFIVALMTHLLGIGPAATVLEIGTGSGYQAAVLSPLAAKDCTIEIIPGLAESAAARLQNLGFENVQARIGDGYFGWPECGPFDGIVVTAAAGHVPPPLVEQLKPGGRMVIPVGGVFGPQFLTLVEKSGDGRVTTRQLLPVRFVPLTQG